VQDANIWVAHRSAVDAPWENPECLEINVDGYEDSNPNFSRDGHWMFFVSNRPGGFGVAGTPPGRDIWLTWRAHVHDDHAWGEPVNAGSVVNTTMADTGPTYFENEGGLPQLFFATQRSGVFDLWVTDVFGDFQFSAPRPVAELNTPDNVEAGPFIRHDGLEIFFFRGPTIFDIFTATRGDPGEPWSTPIRIDAPINSEFNEQAPKLSKDGQTLLFSSNRPGTLGNLDIWMATRVKTTGNP
jgi:WD40-like Beta Propeller Repeat.